MESAEKATQHSGTGYPRGRTGFVDKRRTGAEFREISPDTQSGEPERVRFRERGTGFGAQASQAPRLDRELTFVRELAAHEQPERSLEKPAGMNRRLVRASLSDVRQASEAGKRARRRPVPPEQTFAEEDYYVKQMGARTPMRVVLKCGEVVDGVIEWYDQRCIKVNRKGKPNLLIMKSAISYMYKQPPCATGTVEPAGAL